MRTHAKVLPAIMTKGSRGHADCRTDFRQIERLAWIGFKHALEPSHNRQTLLPRIGALRTPIGQATDHHADQFLRDRFGHSGVREYVRGGRGKVARCRMQPQQPVHQRHRRTDQLACFGAVRSRPVIARPATAKSSRSSDIAAQWHAAEERWWCSAPAE